MLQRPLFARTLLAEPPYDPATERFNDGKCDAQGRFWGGTMDSACREPTGAQFARKGHAGNYEIGRSHDSGRNTTPEPA